MYTRNITYPVHKKCTTNLCNNFIDTIFKQEKYCALCKKRRSHVLSLFKDIKKTNNTLNNFLQEKANINVIYMDGNLLLNISQHNQFGMKRILKLTLTECTKLESEIMLKNILKAYKYIIKNESIFKEVINE